MIEWRKSHVFFRIIACLGIIIILGIAVVFTFRAIEYSRVKDFWGDETFGLEGTTRQATYKQLLTIGARGQGSAAPMDYIFIKALDQAYQKPFVKYIPHNVYYRLNSIFWDLASGLLIAFLFLRAFYRKTDNSVIFVIQLALICMAVVVFYFKATNMHFATEMRPYALWNSLGFVMLGVFMLRGASMLVLLAGILLAFTSSGALIQIPALALSRFFLKLVDRESFADALQEMFFLFTLPFLIAIFYALHADKFSYVVSSLDYQKYSNEFFSFWRSKWRVPALSGFGIVFTIWNRQWRGCTAVFLTMLLLYCVAPVVNAKILSSSFFFTSRQYLYYDLVFPLFYLMLALVLPGYWNMFRNTKNRRNQPVL
ncbi:MAG: hypothetical protein WC412_08260 [Candidatus Omnitrophota bacterium]|jgi:hypothetical protein